MNDALNRHIYVGKITINMLAVKYLEITDNTSKAMVNE